MNALMQMMLYIQKLPLHPIAAFMEGNENVRVQHPVQRANVHTAIAKPRTLFGNISARSTYVIGPRVMA